MSLFSILYVEDNEHLRETVVMLMAGSGRDVVLCTTGEEAIEAIAARRFDLVVTDVGLPGVSGIEFAAHLLAKQPDCRVVLCSGHDVADSARRLGANVRTLRKPFEFEDLEALIVAAEAMRPRPG